MPQLYLASKSPRRREILNGMGVTRLTVITVGQAQLTAYEGDEVQHPGESAADYVVRTARDKAIAALALVREQGLPPGPVLAADTVVICDGEVLGKPVDARQAAEFMRRLSGRAHEVRTAVVVGTAPEDLRVAVSVSSVTFAELSDDQIQRYVATSEPYDKAGGYGIQGLAGLFVERICGSYSGIMGLPVFETGRLLKPYNLCSL